MNKAIFKYFRNILLICLMISSSISMYMVSSMMHEATSQDMLFAVKLVDYQIDYTKDIKEQLLEINPLTYSDHTRLTIITKDGVVLGDTDEDELENHLEREEVQQALKTGTGFSSRYSNTVHKNLMYVAYFDGQHITRLSIPYDGLIDNMQRMIVPFSCGFIISLLIAAVMAKSLSNRLAKPAMEISKAVETMSLDSDITFDTYPYEEYNTVTKAIKEQSIQLSNTLNILRLEQKKIKMVVDQMNEGFILLDTKQEIILVNKVAKTVFNHSLEIQTNIRDCIFDQKIMEALENKDTKKQVIELVKDHCHYACYISKVSFGVAILIVDVTLEHNATKMRQEFFGNVSHELKTPMTSIKGYGELLQTGIIEDPKMKKMALDKIQLEIDNMSTLINDILMISRLENKDMEQVKHPIVIKYIVDELIDSIQIEANKRDIKLYNECDLSEYASNHQHIHQLLNNLLFNAMKYNKEGGSVYVTSKIEAGYMKIRVKDTGIGIPTADQQRVFERFYRVEKGRDKSSGGTGLGLSIVKHIVQYYNGYIDLKSELDIGTTITVYLPIK